MDSSPLGILRSWKKKINREMNDPWWRQINNWWLGFANWTVRDGEQQNYFVILITISRQSFENALAKYDKSILPKHNSTPETSARVRRPYVTSAVAAAQCCVAAESGCVVKTTRQSDDIQTDGRGDKLTEISRRENTPSRRRTIHANAAAGLPHDKTQTIQNYIFSCTAHSELSEI